VDTDHIFVCSYTFIQILTLSVAYIVLSFILAMLGKLCIEIPRQIYNLKPLRIIMCKFALLN